jgi:hypothetical protein
MKKWTDHIDKICEDKRLEIPLNYNVKELGVTKCTGDIRNSTVHTSIKLPLQ